jgi:dTDP-4-amino-4,6-dideoxygalactose transaminase
LAQIRRIDEFLQKRRENAKYLTANIESVITTKVKPGYEHVWHQYTIRVDGNRDRDAAVKKLNDAGVGTGIFYPVPAHQQGYMRDIVGDISLPVSEKMAKQVISLPVHPQVSKDDLKKIVSEVNKL